MPKSATPIIPRTVHLENLTGITLPKVKQLAVNLAYYSCPIEKVKQIVDEAYAQAAANPIA